MSELTTTILVIEDDSQIRRVVKGYLEQAGYRVLAAPDGATGLALAQHEKPALIVLDLMLPGVDGWAITQRLRASEYRDVFQVIPVLALQPDDLLQALNEHRPKIVQFSGHGYAQGELAFVDEQGRAVPVSADALRTVFAALRGDIRLVILNACYSAEQTAAIAEVIDCVIGMKDKISDDGAIAFAASFYRALGFGCSIRNAFDQAVAAVKLQNKGEETIPQMLSLPGVHPDQMILVAPDLPLLLESTVHKGETP